MTTLTGEGSYSSEEELENDYVAPSDEPTSSWEETVELWESEDKIDTFIEMSKENIEEDTSDPWGTLAQGATGPAPAPTGWNEDGTMQVESPRQTEEVNEPVVTAIDEAGEAASAAGEDFRNWLPENWRLWAAGGAALLVLFVLAPYAELASKGVEAAG